MKYIIINLLVLSLIISSCDLRNKNCSLNIHPKPSLCEEFEGSFTINTNTQIVIKEFTATNMEYATLIHKAIYEKTGHLLGVIESYQGRSKNCIIIEESKESELGESGYEVLVTPNTIRLKAIEKQGYLYATQTFIEIMRNSYIDKNSIPCMYVKDVINNNVKRESLIELNNTISTDSIYKHIDNMLKIKSNKLIIFTNDTLGYDKHEMVKIRNYAKKNFIDIEINNKHLE